MKIIGLTGGIGSGKTTVAKLFEELGIPIVDADTVARHLREPGQQGHALIIKRFGTDDRARLRELLSQDPAAKKDLEEILHPLIKAESEREFIRLKALHPAAPFLIYEATLLIEAGRAKDFDAVILVMAPHEVRIDRVTLRDQTTSEAVLKLMQSQLMDEERRQHATYVIENHGSLDDLRQQVKALYDRILLPI